MRRALAWLLFRKIRKEAPHLFDAKLVLQEMEEIFKELQETRK